MKYFINEKPEVFLGKYFSKKTSSLFIKKKETQ